MEFDTIDFQSTDFHYFDGESPRLQPGVRPVEVPLGFANFTDVITHVFTSLGFGQTYIEYYATNLNWSQIDDLYLGQELDCLHGTISQQSKLPAIRTALIHSGVPLLRDAKLEDDVIRSRYLGWLSQQIAQNDIDDEGSSANRMAVCFHGSSRAEIERILKAPSA